AIYPRTGRYRHKPAASHWLEASHGHAAKCGFVTVQESPMREGRACLATVSGLMKAVEPSEKPGLWRTATRE
ncbi:hypothetical protein Dimus_030217, partial [Dionaea muscipula]